MWSKASVKSGVYVGTLVLPAANFFCMRFTANRNFSVNGSTSGPRFTMFFCSALAATVVKSLLRRTPSSPAHRCTVAD